MFSCFAQNSKTKNTKRTKQKKQQKKKRIKKSPKFPFYHVIMGKLCIFDLKHTPISKAPAGGDFLCQGGVLVDYSCMANTNEWNAMGD